MKIIWFSPKTGLSGYFKTDTVYFENDLYNLFLVSINQSGSARKAKTGRYGSTVFTHFVFKI